MRRLTVFGQELAGTLRRASVVDALLRHIREAFAPAEIAVSLYHRDVDALASVHEWPGGGPDRRALLDLAARRGPLLLADGLDPLVHEGAIAPQPGAGGCWLIVPLIAKARVTGSVAVRGDGPTPVGVFGLATPRRVELSSARIPHFTPRQRETLMLLGEGASTEMIARELGVARETARNHVRAVLRELGVKTRLEAVVEAHARGLL